MLLHFLCSGFEYKESKMEKSAYCGLGAKIPGAGGGSWRRTAPALRGSCMDLDLHHLTGSFCLRRGCVASHGGFPVARGTGSPAGSRYLRWGASRRKSLPPLGGVPPEVATSVWGASCRKSLPPFGGRSAGSRYLRWGASCRESLPPLGGRPAGSCYLRWGASRRKGFLCLERAPPDRVISSSARCP